MPRLADRQVERRERRVRHDASKALPEALERVRRQARKSGVQRGVSAAERESIRDPVRRGRAPRDRRCAMAALIDDVAPRVGAPRAPWVWRIASWIATAGGVLLLGYAIAWWGWRWLGPAPAPPAIDPIAERWAPAIAAAPLFGRTGAPAVREAGTAATFPGDARLLGVFAESNGAGFALFRLADRGPVLVKAGADIASGVTLVEVRPGGVRIRDHGELRDIELRAPTAPQRTAATRVGARSLCTPPAGYQGAVYRLNAELLTGVASRPESWQALLTPVAGGLAVRDGSGFAAMLGMKPGDRMTQANGIALTRIDDVQVAFVNPLIASQPVRVAGIRDGKAAEWLFVNASACPG